MKRAFIAAVLIALPACDRQTGGDLSAPIELPKVFGVQALDEQDRISIELTAEGVVRLEGRRVSLDGLTEALTQQKRTRGYHKAWNIYGTTRHEVGEASDLYVLVRADRRAPWQHVSYLLAILMEERIDRVQFAVEGGRIDVNLPADVAIEWIQGQEPRETIINVDVLSGRTPTYRVTEHKTTDAAGTIAMIRARLKTTKTSLRGKDVGIVGQVRAAKAAHLDAVLDVYARMQTCGFTQVAFFGTLIPSRTLRALRSLPRPKASGLAPWKDLWTEDDD